MLPCPTAVLTAGRPWAGEKPNTLCLHPLLQTRRQGTFLSQGRVSSEAQQLPALGRLLAPCRQGLPYRLHSQRFRRQAL